MVFPKWTNYLPLVILINLGGAVTFVIFAFTWWGTDKHLVVGYKPEQPIKYSHRLHAGEMGIDCRYCHFTVENSPSAGVPPTEVCMNCHSQVKTESPEIKKLTEAHNKNEAIEWIRVHKLPEYAYFNHSAHVNKGVSCVECHGRVDQMEEVRHSKSLTMGFCIDCHRAPESHLRDKKLVTKLSWKPEGDAKEYGKKYFEKYHVNTRTDCSACHR